MAKTLKTRIPPSLAQGFRQVITPERKTYNSAGAVRRSPTAMYPARADPRALIIRRAEIAAEWLVRNHANSLRASARLAWKNARKYELINGIFSPEYWQELAKFQDEILPPRAAAGWRDEQAGAIMLPVEFSIIARTYDAEPFPQASEGAPIWYDAEINLKLSAEQRGHWIWLQPSLYTHFSDTNSEQQQWQDVFNGGFYGSRISEDDVEPPATPWQQDWYYPMWGDSRVGKDAAEQQIVKAVRLNILSQNTAKKYGNNQAWAECTTTADSSIFIARMP